MSLIKKVAAGAVGSFIGASLWAGVLFLTNFDLAVPAWSLGVVLSAALGYVAMQAAAAILDRDDQGEPEPPAIGRNEEFPPRRKRIDDENESLLKSPLGMLRSEIPPPPSDDVKPIKINHSEASDPPIAPAVSSPESISESSSGAAPKKARANEQAQALDVEAEDLLEETANSLDSLREATDALRSELDDVAADADVDDLTPLDDDPALDVLKPKR